MIRRIAIAVAATLGGVLGAWALFVRVQGDSEVAFGAAQLADMWADDPTLHGTIELHNRGRQPAVVRRVSGRIVEGSPATVTVTRAGTTSNEFRCWVANLLPPGERCSALVDIELVQPADGPIVVELDVEEIGRSLAVHRETQFTVHPPANRG
jgi:hypothetical protein